MKKIDRKELHNIFIGIRTHNELEFNKLYDNYKSLVYGVAFSILKNKEDSEEIVQAVFIKIFKLETEKLPTAKEASWLYEVTKNEAINYLRNKKNEISIDEIYYITTENKELEEIIETDTYNKIIAKLPLKEQEIVSLKIISKLSFREISKILDIPIGTVQWRYYKAIHTLKILLSSLSMYIMSMCIYIIQRLKTKNRKESNTEKAPKNENKVIKEETGIKDQEQKETEKKENLREENTIKNDTSKIESIQENVIEDTTNITPLEMGLISLSSIFLIISIAFLIIFIKHQQKAKKKASK